MAMIPFICSLLQEVSNQCHSWGITSETGELRLVGCSLCMRFHQLSGRQTKSFVHLTFHSSGLGCRLRAGVGDSFTEEAARERDKYGYQ